MLFRSDDDDDDDDDYRQARDDLKNEVSTILTVLNK